MNKIEIIKYAVEEFVVHGNLEIINTHFASNYIAHTENEKYLGHDILINYSKQFHKTFSNVSIVNLVILMEDDDCITWQRTIKGIHIASINGISPSNKMVKWNEMIVSRFENDKISEEWIVSDLVGQLLLKLK